MAGLTVSSLIGISYRYKAEKANRAVGIVVEAQTVADLDPSVSIMEKWQLLKDAGVTGVVIHEEYLGEWYGNKVTTNQVSGITSIDSKNVLPGELARIEDSLKAHGISYGRAAEGGFLVTASEGSLKRLSLGLPTNQLPPPELELDIVSRFSNSELLTKEAMAWLVSTAKSHGSQFFLPMGDAVPGATKHIEDFMEILNANQFKYLEAEFTKTVGESGVKSKHPEIVIRLHAAQSAELTRMGKAAVVERYAKAARERNMRMLLVRPMDISDGIEGFAGLISSIKNAVIKDGGGVKNPRPFDNPNRPPWIPVVIALFLAPILFWVGTSLFSGGIGKVAGLGGLLAGFLPAHPSFVGLGALAGSIGVLLVGYLWLMSQEKIKPLAGYLVISGCSIVAGLQVAGLLVGQKYMIQAAVLPGVKAQTFLPILVVAYLCLAKFTPIKEFFKSPVNWGTAFGTLFVLIALLFMMSRTGNDNPAGVSGLELQFRDLLDALLPARPRTKEFMIGHPALVMGLGLLAGSGEKPYWRGIGLALLAFSVIGQTSVVNTMCHLHTPVELSVMRVVIGHVFGGILGLLGLGLIKSLLPRLLEEQTGSV